MFHASARGESLDRRFRSIATAIYLAVLVVVVWLFMAQWHGFWDSYQAKHEYQALQAALRAMADVSSERRPAYAMIMIDGPPPRDRIDALHKARAATDARMQELEEALHDRHCVNCVEMLPQWERAAARLAEARQNLDALADKPQQTRTDEEVLGAFLRLSSVIPQLSALADAGSIGVIRENADVQSYVMAARLSSLIREHAGLLASEFAPALVRHRALNGSEAYEIASTLGKIEQLHQLLAPSIKVLPPTLQADYADLSQRFLGDGIAFVRRLEVETSHPGGADLTPLRLAEQYGPMIDPINRFRDDALMLAHDRIEQSLRAHFWLLMGSGLFAMVLTGILLLMIWRFRQKIIQPFADARRFILAIASGNVTVKLPKRSYGSEVQDLFSALLVLRENDARRLHLEKERKRLIGELRTMAETDPLTGLLNRRALDAHAQALLHDKRANGVIALIMMDIDHFKSINDTWGHESGDYALMKLASICRDTVRAEDIVARTGGEEFVILLRVQAPGDARALAEKLRVRLLNEVICANTGRDFSITASFGVAVAQRETAPDLPELMREADALLYSAKQNGRNRVESAPG